MYGKKKRILIVVIILFLVGLVGGTVFFLISNKKTEIGIEYIGGDKYVDDTVKTSDFKVIDLSNNKKIATNKYTVSADPLNVNGTVVTITTTINGKECSGEITVYPTLAITSIKAELISTNKHINSKIEPKDFKVIGTNNKGKKIELKDFTLSHTTLKEAENDVTIQYKTSAGTVSTTLHISVTENFVKGIEAKYIGKTVFMGESVEEDAFDVYAVWDDDTKTKVEDYNLEDGTLTGPTTVLTISYTDDLGKTYYADVKVKGTNYVRDIDHVSYVGQKQTIGNSVEKSDFEVYGTYYDGTVSKIDNFKIRSSAV